MYSTFADKSAFGLSMACALHCLFMPLFVAFYPSIFPPEVKSEFIHFFLLLVIVPVSLFALRQGFLKHKSRLIFLLGISGLFCLCAAYLLAHDFLGEIGETGFTLLGSVLLVFAHMKNYLVCRRLNCSDCIDLSSQSTAN